MPVTEDAVRDALKEVLDPELGVNIVDLGLVYRIDVDGSRVRLEMTMTSPACPLFEYMKDLVDSAVKSRIPEVGQVEIVLVWEPPWTPDMMTADARQRFG